MVGCPEIRGRRRHITEHLSNDRSFAAASVPSDPMITVFMFWKSTPERGAGGPGPCRLGLQHRSDTFPASPPRCRTQRGRSLGPVRKRASRATNTTPGRHPSTGVTLDSLRSSDSSRPVPSDGEKRVWSTAARQRGTPRGLEVLLLRCHPGRRCGRAPIPSPRRAPARRFPVHAVLRLKALELDFVERSLCRE